MGAATGDGVLTREELAQTLKLLDPSVWTDETVNVLLDTAQLNKHGKITYTDFFSYLTKKDCVTSSEVGENEKQEAMIGEADKKEESMTGYSVGGVNFPCQFRHLPSMGPTVR